MTIDEIKNAIKHGDLTPFNSLEVSDRFNPELLIEIAKFNASSSKRLSFEHQEFITRMMFDCDPSYRQFMRTMSLSLKTKLGA